MKLTLLILHWRNGRIETRTGQPGWPLPDRVSPDPGDAPRVYFRLGAEREQFAHRNGKEVLCHVGRYWEEA